jgi:hypothetical protein
MAGFFSFLGKTLLNLVFWVFLFSIPIANKPIFEYLQRALVFNAPVRFLSQEWNGFWGLITEKAKVAFTEKKEEETMAQ